MVSSEVATMNASPTEAAASTPEFSALDEDGWKAQDESDDVNIQRLLGQSQETGGGIPFLNLDDDTPFDQSGKAADAQDFEDISDDDLPEEEPPTATVSFEVPGLTDDGGTSHDTDDLFGEGRESSPFENLFPPTSPPDPNQQEPGASDPETRPDNTLGDIDFGPETDFNGAANQDPDIPPAIESVEDLLRQKWPAFEQGIVLNWNGLLPPKEAKWVEKKPPRKPKALITSKLSLDLAPDQEKMFRIPGGNGSRKRTYQDLDADGLIYIQTSDTTLASEDVFSLDAGADDELVGGYSLQDIATLCYDFATQIEDAEKTVQVNAANESQKPQPDSDGEDEWDAMFMDEPPRKKKKQRTLRLGLPDLPRYSAPSFDKFDDITKKVAKRVLLDLNDPKLTIEEPDANRSTKRPRLDQGLKRMANGHLGRDVLRRFNLSNDDAYDLLKENHRNKVRATLGNLVIDHALPALKLAWPYYKVRLGETPDQFHRPPFRVRKYTGMPIHFHKLDTLKRKNQKGKIRDVFKETKDLTLMDNSASVLFEYCERIPTVLSKFGMGNRVLNYYRKPTGEDSKSGAPEEPIPKLDVGETQVLLPEDRSPFSIFGTVSAGEIVPTLHNQMYRAPIFKHSPRPGDFILGRSTTGVHGAKWYVRKIDHIFVVGQTFPSVEVPGPHSRKVTNASKNRIKMISYRLMRKDPNQLANLPDVTKHIADSTDSQNRQKLKEFLTYAKTEKGQWKLREGETLMTEERIRAMIKPEETCLIDGMYLGMKQLEDAGFDPRNALLDDEEDDPDDDQDGAKTSKVLKKAMEKAEETLADKMAPWKTTKAFIDACNGKAMLQLHGEGDPTGHGLGFSFIRTSMKGGYIEAVQGPLATSADAMERQKKDNNGHAYNVKKQEAMYKEGIREIWEKQKSTLSDPTPHDDDDVLHTVDEDERFDVQTGQTPAPMDDGTSQISGFTSASRHSKKRLRIMRKIERPDGTVEERNEIVEDPVVIAHYLKRRTELEAESKDLYEILPTGNADKDRIAEHRILEELARLEKNRDRRKIREKQKEIHRRANFGGADQAGSPDGQDKSTTGTTRKCANCGQVGHIKTNKKLCPLLNGTIKSDGGENQGGFGSFNSPTPAGSRSPAP